MNRIGIATNPLRLTVHAFSGAVLRFILTVTVDLNQHRVINLTAERALESSWREVIEILWL